MLNYREILAYSQEIQNIPDQWVMSIPIVCHYNNQFKIAFLYYDIDENRMAHIQEMLAVSISDGSVEKLCGSDIRKLFGIEDTFHMPFREEIDNYFDVKDNYENIVDDIYKCLYEGRESLHLKEYATLYKKLIPQPAYDEVFSILGRRLLCYSEDMSEQK